MIPHHVRQAPRFVSALPAPVTPPPALKPPTMSTPLLPRLVPRQLIRIPTRRCLATVRQDLYNIPAPPSAVRPRPPPKRPLHDPVKEAHETQVHYNKLRWMLYAGGVGLAALAYMLTMGDPLKTEAPTSSVIKPGTAIALMEPESVDSGTSSVPAFPRKLVLQGEEYVLVGLGIRTVSFLGIQVYVVGFYIHKDDLEKVQKKLVEAIQPGASSITAPEREELEKRLLDPVEGEKLWEEILRDGKFRSVFRIVPTRNTGLLPRPRHGIALMVRDRFPAPP
jgi:hypothetical protein